MLELKDDKLEFSFPQVHEDARLTIDFQRTLRIPDDGETYPLPMGFGDFPLRHTDDFGRSVPDAWLRHGGVIMPMYQSEAIWISFRSHHRYGRESSYPFAIKIATGKVSAISGGEWLTGLHRDPQDYLVAPEQPWLDGYCVDKGTVRQFVAMPLGQGYTAEEQITGDAKFGGLQIMVYPMKGSVYEKRFPVEELVDDLTRPFECRSDPRASHRLGLAPGGKIQQSIYDDPFLLSDWDMRNSHRCFVHIANSASWHDITGERLPQRPITVVEYFQAGLPWFSLYDDDFPSIPPTPPMSKLESIMQKIGKLLKRSQSETESPYPQNIVRLRNSKNNRVREWSD